MVDEFKSQVTKSSGFRRTTSPKEMAEASTAEERGLPKPEAVKIDIPALNSTLKSEKMTKRKRPSQTAAVPDVFGFIIKDTTSDHKTHVWDLNCTICTGKMRDLDEEEPKKKKAKLSVSTDKRNSYGRSSARIDSTLRAPPDMTSSASSLMEPPSNQAVGFPSLTRKELPPLLQPPASAATLSELQHMLGELNKQIEIEERQIKQRKERLCQRRRGWGMLMVPNLDEDEMQENAKHSNKSAGEIENSDIAHGPSSGSYHSRKHMSSPKKQSCHDKDRHRSRSRQSRQRSPSHSQRHQETPKTPSITSGSSDQAPRQAIPHVLKKDNVASQAAPAPSRPPTKTFPKSIIVKPTSNAEPRISATTSRTMVSQSPAEETVQFLAKPKNLWKGCLNLPTVAKFVTKGYLVSGSAENLKVDLPDTIQIGGRILPQTVWDYVSKQKTSPTKELCVIRFQPATEEEEVAYDSLFSYFNSRGRFGVVTNCSRSVKDVYLVPLGAKEPLPSILQPLEGPGIEPNHPKLLLGIAVVQRTKRPGSLLQGNREKKTKVQMAKDPAALRPLPCPGSPSDSSFSGSVTIPPLSTSTKKTPPVSTSASVIATQPTSSSQSDSPITAKGKESLQYLMNVLFHRKSSDSTN